MNNLADGNADEFFSPWEQKITSWKNAQTWLERTQAVAGSRRSLVWRGVSNASYSLSSSLYRELQKTHEMPTEQVMRHQERFYLDIARERWRFDGRNPLELMANLQHFGAPTRLIDVTYNPLVALWFACSIGSNQDSSNDGRLFIFDVSNRELNLDITRDSQDLPWFHNSKISSDRWHHQLPFVWRPPSYIERIAAQNAAFLIGGIPNVRKGQNNWYRKGPGNGAKMGTWKIDEVRNATSVPLRMNSLTTNASARSTPTFTLRIAAKAKEEIRRILDRHYGINAATLFPEMYGLAQFIQNEAIDITKSRHPSRGK